jgi:hypothetical protein
MDLTRRTLLAGTGALAATATLPRRSTLAATSAINAVRLLQGSLSKLGSVIYQDTMKLGVPISAQQIFLNVATLVRNSMPQGYPGIYPLVGIYDANGDPNFAVNLLPPSTSIPGSISNPMLQVILAAGSQAAAPRVSFVIPEFTAVDGWWHTLNLSIGMLPTNPARWVITAVDVNNAKMAFTVKQGFWTDQSGIVPFTNQIPPPAFNVPLIRSGLPNDNNMAFAIGAQLKDKLAGYSPVPAQFLVSTPMDYTQLYLSFNPPAGNPPPLALPSFLNMAGFAARILSSVNATQIAANAAEDAAGVLMRVPPPGTPVQSVTNAMANVQNSLTSTLTTATQNGASAALQNNLLGARTTINTAMGILRSMDQSNPLQSELNAVYTTTLSIATQMNAAMQLANLQLLPSTNSAYTAPMVTNVNNVSTVTTVNGVGAPNVVSQGNATATNTTIVSGNVVTVDNGSGTSMLNNQVNNVTMNGGGAPVQPASSDPSVTIEQITITPNIP